MIGFYHIHRFTNETSPASSEAGLVLSYGLFSVFSLLHDGDAVGGCDTHAEGVHEAYLDLLADGCGGVGEELVVAADAELELGTVVTLEVNDVVLELREGALYGVNVRSRVVHHVVGQDAEAGGVVCAELANVEDLCVCTDRRLTDIEAVARA